jgi:hypothetical protein
LIKTEKPNRNTIQTSACPAQEGVAGPDEDAFLRAETNKNMTNARTNPFQL